MSVYNIDSFTPGLGDGEPGNLTLIGTGSAVPGGLECVFEYNGLLLNVHRNVDRYKVNNIDGLGDADIRDVRDENSDDDGETPYNSLYGGRTIVISGSIDTYSIAKLRDMQMALRSAFVDISTEYPLIFRTGNFQTDHMIYCKKIGAINMGEQQQDTRVKRDFQISLRASDPRFYSYWSRFFDHDFSGAITTAEEIGTLTNLGNYRTRPIFKIYGPSRGARFWNVRTGKGFAIRFIDDGDYVEFDMAKNSPTLINRLGENQWEWLMDGSRYIDILRGDNPIFYQGDCSRVEISWRNSWL